MMFFEDDIYGDSTATYLESVRAAKTSRFVSGPSVLAYGFLAVTVGYHMLQYINYPVLPISELAWNILVYLTPSRIISVFDPRVNGLNLSGPPGDWGTWSSRHHALKSEALRRIIGVDVRRIIGRVRQAQHLPGVSTLLPGKNRNMESGCPPGLGNWDNSCYQNSVIQGLASLQHLPSYLARSRSFNASFSIATSLRNFIAALKDASSIGLVFWIPIELKTMSSWQQQDAQEYFSTVLDEVGRDVAASQKEMHNLDGGLASLPGWLQSSTGADHSSKTENMRPMNMNIRRRIRGIDQLPAEVGSTLIRSPLEGLLAQRVGCLKCGYVEGLSLIPFNCLTVPLGNEWIYDIRTCLDNYTALEPISGVECVKCTLLCNKLQLEKLFAQTRDSAQDLNGTPFLTQALHASIKDRLSALEKVLNEGDFSDNTILKKCEIPTNQRVSTTKSRQAVVARAPKSLVIHVNRSVFDEATGMLCKNFAEVRYPLELDLAPWCLGTQSPTKDEAETVEKWSLDPSKSMHALEAEDMASSDIDSTSPTSQQRYKLRAVITHFGQHENGHYICYRKHRLDVNSLARSASESPETWWCFNDEEVFQVCEAEVLEQGGVFMLFYEKIELAKDVILGLPKHHDPDLLGALPGPVETTSERKGIIVVDGCLPSETISTRHVTNIKKDMPIGVMDNAHGGPLSMGHWASYQLLENPEASAAAEVANDATPSISQTSLGSLSSPTTFQESRETPLSDESTTERPAKPQYELLEPSLENSSSVEAAAAELFGMQLFTENHSSLESCSTDDAINTEESFGVIASTTDENTKPVTPELGTAKPEDVPDKSPIRNRHRRMRTASPLSSRGSVSRAGKAMSNVSAMVIAN